MRLAAALMRFWWFRGSPHRRAGAPRVDARALPARLSGTRCGPRRFTPSAVLTYRHAERRRGRLVRGALPSGGEPRDLPAARKREGAGRRASEPRACLRRTRRVGQAAYSVLDESLEIGRRSGNRLGIASSHFNLGYTRLLAGDLPSARTRLEEALHAFRELDDRFWIAACLVHLGYIDCEEGEYDAARSRFIQMGQMIPLVQFSWGTTYALDGFARLAAAEGEAVRALRLGGATTALRQTYGVTIGPARTSRFPTKSGAGLASAGRGGGPGAGKRAWR